MLRPQPHRTAGLLLLLCLGASAQGTAPEEPFLRQVLARNPSLRAESLSVAATKATREGSVSLLLPQFQVGAKLDANTDLDRTHNASGQATVGASQLLPSGATLSGELLASRSHGSTPTRTVSGYSPAIQMLADTLGFALPASTVTTGGSSTRDTVGLQIALTQPLLKGFGAGNATFHAAEQARLSEKVQLQSSRAQVLSVISLARKAWWNQRSLEALLETRIQDTARTLRLLDATRKRFREGASSRLDTLQAFADHLQARSAFASARSEAASGAVTLGSYLDSGAVWIGTRGDSTLINPPLLTESVKKTPDELMALAEASAPDIAQALSLEEKARSEEIFRSRQALPQLDAGVYLRKAISPSDANPTGIQYGAQALFQWNLTDGTDRAAARKALLDLRKSGIAAAKARKDLHRSLVLACEKDGSLRQALDLKLQVVEAQELRLFVAEQGYREGSTSWSDLATARKERLAALTDAWSAVAAVQANESDLQSLTGTGPARLGWTWGE